MTRRWIIAVLVLLLATPSVLYARWIKDKVYLETKDVGVVEFSMPITLRPSGKTVRPAITIFTISSPRITQPSP